MISWLFEIDTLNLSTSFVEWNSTSYLGSIIPSSFSGITMRWDISGGGLIAPNDMSFDVSNTNSTYSVSDFENKFCIIRLIIDGTEIRAWKLKIETAISYYGKITCDCVDFLQEYLTGDYPNTVAQKEVWPSNDVDEDYTDDSCIPVVLGTAYIPVKSVNTGTDRYYVLGESGPTYTVHEVKSPRSWPNTSTWDSSSYSMNGYTNSGYQLLQPIIADSDGDGTADAPGLWRSGDVFYDMLCRFERNDTSSKTNPADWFEYLIEDFGIDSSDIDTTSFTTTSSLYSTLGISFPGGGWWKKTTRESVLSNLLAQTDSFIIQSDKIELYQFDKTSKETITNVLKLSFSPSSITKSSNDSGGVSWPESSTLPSDVLNGKTVVPTHSGGSEDNTSSDTLKCNFLAGQSENAQKAGILYYQKKYEQSKRVSLSVSLDSLTTKDSLSPGHVITINNSLYGGTSNVIITEMTINKDMKVDISGVILNYLEDWGDLTTTAKTIVTDSSDGFQIASTDYNGNISADADWNTLLNIPDRFLDTAQTGINVTDSYMGYYDGSDFSVYIDSSGNMRAGDPDTAQGFVWNQSTGAFTISGSLTIQNPSGVRSDLNVADGADVTADNPQNAAWLTDSGVLATLDSINMSYVNDAGDLATVDADALVYYSTTAPVSPAANPLWGDTSSTPYKLKRYNGSGWDVIATLNTGALADVDAADWSTQITGTGKPADNADVTADNAQSVAWLTDAGAMAYEDLVEFSKLGTTVVSGGYIKTSLLDVDDIFTNNITVSGTLTFSSESNLLYFGGYGSSTRIYGSATTLNVTSGGSVSLGGSGSFTRIYNDSQNIDLRVESSKYVKFQRSSTDLVVFYSGVYGGTNPQFRPAAGETVDLGQSGTQAWNNVYGNYFHGDGSNLTNLPATTTYTDLYVGNRLYHSGDTDTYLQYNTDDVRFYVGGSQMLRLNESTNNTAYIDSRYLYYQNSGTTYLQTSCDGTNLFVYPLNATGKYFGSSSYRWTSMYTTNIYRTNEINLDVYDDLYQLSQIQPKKRKTKNDKGEEIEEDVVNEKGLPIMDPLKLPIEMTNYDEVVMQLKAENGNLISDEDIQELIQDDDEAGHLLKINSLTLANLTTGAVRQLDKEVIEMFDLLSERITKLEQINKTLKTGG